MPNEAGQINRTETLNVINILCSLQHAYNWHLHVTEVNVTVHL